MLTVLEILKLAQETVKTQAPNLCVHGGDQGGQDRIAENAMWYRMDPRVEVYYIYYPDYQEGGRPILRVSGHEWSTENHEWAPKRMPVITVIDWDPYYEHHGETTVRVYKGLVFTPTRADGPTAEELDAMKDLFQYVHTTVPNLQAPQ